MSVRVEKAGPVTTVILRSPRGAQRRRPRARRRARRGVSRLRGRRRRARRGAVGRGRQLLRGRRSEGARRRHAQPRRAGRRRADGADALSLAQAGDRGGGRLRRRRRARAGLLVRSARGRGGRDVRRLLPSLGRAAHRRRHGAPAAPHRAVARARSDPDGARGRRPPRRWRWGWPTASCRTGQARAAAEALARELAALPQLCLRNDRMSAYEQFGMTLPEAMDNEFAHGWTSLAHAAEGVDRFAGGAGRHGRQELAPSSRYEPEAIARARRSSRRRRRGWARRGRAGAGGSAACAGRRSRRVPPADRARGVDAGSVGSPASTTSASPARSARVLLVAEADVPGVWPGVGMTRRSAMRIGERLEAIDRRAQVDDAAERGHELAAAPGR